MNLDNLTDDQKNKLNELIDAYSELWAATENGTVNNDFFELRSRFRENMANLKN